MSRRCRHVGADLANRTLDEHSRLICLSDISRRTNVRTGRMVRGKASSRNCRAWAPAYRALTRVVPLRRGQVLERDWLPVRAL